jgi:uncharacterized protein YhbP (UPF0306 family)
MNGSSEEAGSTRALLREYLRGAKLMQVATVRDAQPWMANVWFAMDESFRLYFISRGDRRHSKEIRANRWVAGSIVQPPFEGLGQKVRGVTFEGEATELEDDDLVYGYDTYRRRWPQVESSAPLPEIASGKSQTRVYRVVPRLFVLFDEVNYPKDPRQEIRL